MIDPDAVLLPWLDRIAADAGPLSLFDAHTHLGANDPDGYKQRPEELLAVLEHAGARAAVFAMHEPDGYPPANDMVLAAAAAADGRLVAFTRVDPHAPGAVDEARRCLDAGARGIKLHPRAEQFGLDEPVVRDLVALAHERTVPVLIHAGRGIPALGRHTIHLAEEFQRARLILAHAAISDLAWLWRVLPAHPNVFIDTAWWHPADLVALFALVPPGQILWASDSPYGLPVVSAGIALRCALEAGLEPEQLRLVAGGQLERLLAGEDPVDAGPAPGPPPPVHPLLERVGANITAAFGRTLGRDDPAEQIALAKLACAVGDDVPEAPLYGALMGLLELYEEHLAPPEGGQRFPTAMRFLLFALTVSRTPRVPLPDRLAAPPPTRDEADHA